MSERVEARLDPMSVKITSRHFCLQIDPDDLCDVRPAREAPTSRLSSGRARIAVAGVSARQNAKRARSGVADVASGAGWADVPHQLAQRVQNVRALLLQLLVRLLDLQKVLVQLLALLLHFLNEILVTTHRIFT